MDYVGAPPVLISEVMSHPAAGCPEYVEVYNAGPESYDIGGNWIKDRANAPALIAQGSVPIAAGDFLVVTPDRTALQTWFPQLGDNHVVEVAGSWPALNHASGGQSADSVVLFDPFLLAVDRVSYPSQPGDSRGRSLERVDMYPTDGTHVWALAPPGRRGSPGAANPPAIFDRPRGPAMGLSSNPFNPGAGGMLLITVPAGAESGGAVVNLFDVRGRRVRVIGATTQLPFVFTWDGTDDNGQAVTSGFYIIACEYLTRTGRRGRVEKVVLGCARQN